MVENYKFYSILKIKLREIYFIDLVILYDLIVIYIKNLKMCLVT